MTDVNWWLMALSFLLGLVLTFAFMIRRVSREVPVYAALGRGPGAEAPTVDVRKPDADVKAPVVDVDKPGIDLKTAAAGTAATVAGGAAAAKLLKEEPYGSGSVRVVRTAAPPRAEYVVKGDEDTMRYFTVESPDFDSVGAEVWFKDAASAERAGFLRWDAFGAATGAESVSSASGIDDSTATTKFASVIGEPEEGPYGKGTARAGAGGVGPAGWTIKGNEDSMLFHTPASPSYEVTIAEVWFVDEATAEAAGFKKYK